METGARHPWRMMGIILCSAFQPLKDDKDEGGKEKEEMEMQQQQQQQQQKKMSFLRRPCLRRLLLLHLLLQIAIKLRLLRGCADGPRERGERRKKADAVDGGVSTCEPRIRVV